MSLNHGVSSEKRGSCRSTTISEPIRGFGNRSVCEVVKCSQGKVQEVRTGVGFEGRGVAGLREEQR